MCQDPYYAIIADKQSGESCSKHRMPNEVVKTSTCYVCTDDFINVSHTFPTNYHGNISVQK